MTQTNPEQWAVELWEAASDEASDSSVKWRRHASEAAALAIQVAFAEREARANDRALAEIGSALDHELTDVELEAALTAANIGTYGPDATKFEAMFAAAMKCRATLAALKDRTHG